MRVLLKPPLYRKLWLVDWHGLAPFWHRSWQYEEVRDTQFVSAYSPLWFREQGGELRLVVVGEVDYFPGAMPQIMFSNGIHRTNVLAKGLRFLPLSAHADCYRNKALAMFFLRRIERNETFEIPDFPIRGL